MNRITALLLAFAALLTHVLVVHRDLEGAFGPPHEAAHVAFRIARNLVFDGGFHWWRDPVTDVTSGGLWSHPSPLLVLVSALFERVYLPVTRGVQVLGIGSALATVWLCTRFDPTRILSVVSALLLVSCGAVAAAGGSGTEWPLVMVLATTSFVALEKGRPRSAAGAMALLAISTPVALFLVAALCLQSLLRAELFGRAGRLSRLAYFLPAVLAVALAEAAGAGLVDGALRVMEPDAATTAHGLAQLRDFLVSTVSPILLIYPIVALLLGELAPVGRRALGLVAAWCAATVLTGGGPSTFDLAFVPALPLAFIAIQQGLGRALDTYRIGMERTAWIAVALASVGSLAVNRFPPETSEGRPVTLHERLLTPSADRWPEPDRVLGRPSLYSEVRQSNRLREIGSFMRDRLPEDTTLLTPWPGAVGYLAHFHVTDMFGRVEALAGLEATPWAPSPPRANLIAALESEPDYVLPWLNGFSALVDGQLKAGLPEELLRLDPASGDPGYRSRVRALMEQYEPMVTADPRDVLDVAVEPVLLLRRRGEFDPPVIRHRVRAGGTVEFLAGFGSTPESGAFNGLPQAFDTVVVATRADDSSVILDPIGGVRARLPEDAAVPTTVGLLIDPQWPPLSSRPSEVSLARIPSEVLLAEPRIKRIDVRLLHYRLPQRSAFADAAEPYTFHVR